MMMLRPLFLFTVLWLAAAPGAVANPFQRFSGGPLSPGQAFRYEMTPEGEAQSLGVIDSPTLVFLNDVGQELIAPRLTGGFTAEALIAALGKARE